MYEIEKNVCVVKIVIQEEAKPVLFHNPLWNQYTPLSKYMARHTDHFILEGHPAAILQINVSSEGKKQNQITREVQIQSILNQCTFVVQFCFVLLLF